MNTPAASIREEAFTFECEGDTLLGLLHHPAADAPLQASHTGVVVIVGGPQYRVGSHRQFVHLARALAAAGHPVLRFDVRGMGDSTGALRHFEQITPDVGAAIDALIARAPAVERVVLWGLCDGASAALLYLHDRADVRVRGVCLLNPWVRSEATQARTRLKHYYTRRLRSREFWHKLLSGRVASAAVRDLLGNLRRARGGQPVVNCTRQPFQHAMLVAWRAFDGRSLLLLSGNDYTAKEFLEFTATHPVWHELCRHNSLERHDLPQADHTLSAIKDRDAATAATLKWLGQMPPPTPTHAKSDSQMLGAALS